MHGSRRTLRVPDRFVGSRPAGRPKSGYREPCPIAAVSCIGNTPIVVEPVHQPAALDDLFVAVVVDNTTGWVGIASQQWQGDRSNRGS
jgi:hypothetical protein